MKKISLFLISAIVAVGVNAQNNKEPFITKSFSAQSFNKVNAETSGGSISLSGNAASSPRIEVYIHAGNSNDNLSKAEIQQRLDENYTLEIDVKNNELVAIAKQKNKITNWKKGLNISFKIYTGDKIDSKLSTSGGSIALENVSGTQNFSTSGGSLSVNTANGNINGRTSGGSISLKDAEGNIDLSTSGGSITAADAKGTLKLHTSGGSIHFQNLNGNINIGTSGGSLNGDDIKGELVARTSGGSIDLKQMKCSFETSTSGGNIQVEIAELGKYAKISNSGGNITLHMPGNKGADLDIHGNKISTPKISNFSGKGDNNSLVGTINGGGARVDVRGNNNVSLYLD
ncbi:MAG: hypothetical protein IT249_09345 [Chitinophagaceae bacterium]|nr:hypothetical protein [Chitinophagaceae bacterium]